MAIHATSQNKNENRGQARDRSWIASLGLALAVVFAVSGVAAQGSIAVFGDSRDNRKWPDTGVWEKDDFIPFDKRYCYCDASDPGDDCIINDIFHDIATTSDMGLVLGLGDYQRTNILEVILPCWEWKATWEEAFLKPIVDSGLEALHNSNDLTIRLAIGNHDDYDLYGDEGHGYIHTSWDYFEQIVDYRYDQEDPYNFLVEHNDILFLGIDSEFPAYGDIVDESKFIMDEDYLGFETDMESIETKWKIAFMHHPPYMSVEGDLEEPLAMDSLMNWLSDEGFHVVMAGHRHRFELGYWQSTIASDEPNAPMLILVNGVAGGDISNECSDDWGSESDPYHWMYCYRDGYGWLELEEEEHPEHGDCLLLTFWKREGLIEDFQDEDTVWRICDADHDGFFNHASPPIESEDETIVPVNDNCPDIYNPDQADWNNDEEGDACDEFARVHLEEPSWLMTVGEKKFGSDSWGGGYGFWTGTRSPMQIDHLSIGAGTHEDSDGPADQEGHMELRWCDCVAYSWDTCEDQYCLQEPSENQEITWNHQDWHFNTWDKDGALGTDQFWMAFFIPHRPLLSDCDTPSTWEDEHVYLNPWTKDEGATNLYTKHCEPPVETFPNPRKETYLDDWQTIWWDWRHELWWVSLNSDLEDTPNKLKGFSGKGYLWARPDDLIGGEYYSEGTNRDMYRQFELRIPGGTIAPWLTRKLPPFEMRFPINDLVNPLLDPALLADVGTAAGGVVLVGFGPDSQAVGESFMFPADTVGPNAALGGMAAYFFNAQTLQPELAGRFDVASAGDAPFTTAFASAWFEQPALQEESDIPGAADGSIGLAAFGGVDATGKPTNTLWVASYVGLSLDGLPNFAWEKAPAASTTPAPRSGAGMFYDTELEQLIVFGGASQSGAPLSDMWAYDLDRTTWNSLSVENLPGIANFSMIQARGRVYAACGETADQPWSPIVYRVDALTPAITPIASLDDGPGRRRGFGMAYDDRGRGGLLFYGGVDQNGVGHNDIWRYDIERMEWSRLARDCEGTSCPDPDSRAVFLADKNSRRMVAFTTERGGRDLYHRFSRSTGWKSQIDIEGPLPEVDCDGDGEIDSETSRPCHSSDVWWADVSRQECKIPNSGETACPAPEAEDYQPAGQWQPDSWWEWIIDSATDEQGRYAYVLTDTTLHTLDLADPTSLWAVDQDALTRPPEWCWWGPCIDIANSVELRQGFAYVATLTGVHVFDLTDPSAPEEVLYAPSHGIARDIAFLDDRMYLADGFGITVFDISDPASPSEVGRASTPLIPQRIGINRKDLKLVALANLGVATFDLVPSPHQPQLEDQLLMIGGPWRELVVDDRWIMTSGLVPRAAYYSPEHGLSHEGGHGLNAWVEGRELRGEEAYRVDDWFNRFEVWSRM